MPSVKSHTPKWRALLAHLTPIFHSTSPVSSAFKRPTPSTPLDVVRDTTYPSRLNSTSPIASVDNLCLIGAAGQAMRPSSGLETDDNVAPPCYNSSLLSNDVDPLLHMCVERPYDLNVQTQSRQALCTLCSATSGAVDRLIDQGGIPIVLHMLNPNTEPRHTPTMPSLSAEKIEKALHLLYLVITTSEAGCAAALQQSTCIIETVGKKLLRVSEAGTATAIAILWRLCCHDSEAALVVSKGAIPSKLVVVLQVASHDSTKRGAGMLMRLLAQPQHQHNPRTA